MKKWEIWSDNFEFRGPIEEASEQNIIDWYNAQTCLDPTLEESYDTEAEARAAWETWKDYGITREQQGYTFRLLVGRLAYLTMSEYDDETGDYDQGGDWYACAVEPYKRED